MTDYQKYILRVLMDWLSLLDKETDLTDGEYLRLTNNGEKDFPDTKGSRQQLNHEIWVHLNDNNILTERGKIWNSKRWRDFRNAFDLTDVKDWLEESGYYTKKDNLGFAALMLSLTPSKPKKPIKLKTEEEIQEEVKRLMKTDKIELKPFKSVFNLMEEKEDSHKENDGSD